MDNKIELESEVVEEILNGRNVYAIKKLRQIRGIGVKESKALVELYVAQNDIANISTRKSKIIKGLTTLIVISAVLYILFSNAG